MNQRDAVIGALEDVLAVDGDDLAYVHVLGPPRDDDDSVRALRDGERLCFHPNGREPVVFHPLAEQFGSVYRCPDCGTTDAPRC